MLIQIAKDGSAPASARVAAARAIIENGVKAVETLDLEPRLKELEKYLAEKKGARK